MTSLTEAAKEESARFLASGEGGYLWKLSLDATKKGIILSAMGHAHNNQSEAARLLCINRATLRTTAYDVFSADELRELGML